MTTAIDSQLFRRAMGHFASGVTVVTTITGEAEPRGMTASAFSSLSLDPPLILVCVSRTSSFYEAITTAPFFAVNFLAAHQQDLSSRFASKIENKFEGVETATGKTGVPLLAGALAHIECARHEVLPGGDHVIVLGRVEHLDVFGGEPLAYFAGKYRALAPVE
ncbi:MAG: flavin reductase family protein [Blastocatellia bacterium]|nr:flavin reductase family protein [Blastocatellia bacterium]